MKGHVALAIIGVLACAGSVGVLRSWTLDCGDADQSVLEADHALTRSFGPGNRLSLQTHLALAELLDEDFTWIDSQGKSLAKPEVLRNFPSPANTDVQVQARSYGQSAVVRASHGNVQVLRVWVKRASGWRVILYQEVAMVAKSEPPPAAEGGSNECENPCKAIPIDPQTPSEREVIASWQGVMQAMASNDADAYAPRIADEFTATDTHHDRSYTKADRLSQIKKQRLAGTRSAPPALLSARMFDFGDTVMMTAREQRPNAKAYFNTRMWVKRDGRWQMLFSFNTRIE